MREKAPEAPSATEMLLWLANIPRSALLETQPVYTFYGGGSALHPAEVAVLWSPQIPAGCWPDVPAVWVRWTSSHQLRRSATGPRWLV